MSKGTAYGSHTNARRLSSVKANDDGQGTVHGDMNNARKLNAAGASDAGHGTVHGDMNNARKLNAVGASNAGQGSAYGSMINARRLGAINADSTGGRASVYGSMINARRLDSVNTQAFVHNGSLYSRLGGESVVTFLVRSFYAKALKDERIRQYFDLDDYRDMEAQIRSQIAVLGAALGGPHKDGIDRRTAYNYLNDMGLSDAQFDAVIEHAAAILRGQNTPPPLIDEVTGFCEDARKKVLG